MSATHGSICIEAKNVSFAYNGTPVLEEISFIIPKGDYVGIIGPNGGGKTTLVRLLLGLIQPKQGTITIFGHSVREAKEHFEIGYVPQNVSQGDATFPATVWEVVMSGRTARRESGLSTSRQDREIVERILQLTEITHLREKSMNSLSGGERQRVYIARALAGEPKILFLDEPTVGVDVAAQKQFHGLLSRLNNDDSLTIVLISHDLDAVAKEVKHIICVNKRLVCHLAARDFDKKNYLRSVYGDDVKPVDHDHEV